MGHKGVSKRKSPKLKIPVAASKGMTNLVAALSHKSDSPLPHTLDKGEAISMSMGGKKKASDAQQKKKKR